MKVVNIAKETGQTRKLNIIVMNWLICIVDVWSKPAIMDKL